MGHFPSATVNLQGSVVFALPISINSGRARIFAAVAWSTARLIASMRAWGLAFDMRPNYPSGTRFSRVADRAEPGDAVKMFASGRY